MEVYGHDSESEWTEPALQESMKEVEVYPQRVGVPHCDYYLRTGFCAYGAHCRYNHPPHPHPHQVGREVQLGVGESPGRVGEPACQYYLRTGRCKFGHSCKFYHPRNAGGSLSNVPLNVYGFPIRPERVECSYYLKTGQCKYGITCIFHHPQPAGITLAAAARPFKPIVQTISLPSAGQHGGPPTSFRPLRHSVLPGAYSPVMYHPAVLRLPNWSPYSGQASPSAQASAATLSPYGISAPSPYGISQLATSAATVSPTYPSVVPYSGFTGRIFKEALFPERLGQPECQFYMKTGNCKFGSSCKYHHPPEVLQSKMNCSLSPLGLPLRPGEKPCTFYMHKGHCSFGHVCKFDHPMVTVKYSSSPHLTDVPVKSYSVKLA